jgi:hypothetical protein
MYPKRQFASIGLHGGTFRKTVFSNSRLVTSFQKLTYTGPQNPANHSFISQLRHDDRSYGTTGHCIIDVPLTLLQRTTWGGDGQI